MKPYSESCQQNSAPILEVLRVEFADKRKLLEIGSGTGQHAVYLAGEFPQLRWQTSDRSEMHAGIQAWLDDTSLTNVLAPLALDVASDCWPDKQYDAIFSANTVHIMSWRHTREMFHGIKQVLNPGGCFCLYGPFNYNGEYTSESNARFDQWLKARDPSSAIRDFEAVNELANRSGMLLIQDHPMPANNRMLVWIRDALIK